MYAFPCVRTEGVQERQPNEKRMQPQYIKQITFCKMIFEIVKLSIKTRQKFEIHFKNEDFLQKV